MQNDIYVIQRGNAGRQRLAHLTKILENITSALLDETLNENCARVIDIGCGKGDVTAEIQKRTGGKVVGVDMDLQSVAAARMEYGHKDLEFHVMDITQDVPKDLGEFDVVHVRFVLTHLTNPFTACQNLFKLVKPGGMIILMDIDFRGHFCEPPNAAYDKFLQDYTRLVTQRGANPNIGTQLPGFLKNLGMVDIQFKLHNPAGFDRDVKLIHALTMEAISENLIQTGLVTRQEAENVVEELHVLANDSTIFAGMPRIVQTWARRP